MTPGIPYHERLVLAHPRPSATAPLLSVAIPHYKHRRHLQVVLDSLLPQTFDDFEIVISDDQSPDDSAAVIPALLRDAGRAFRYYRQPHNLGYDGNVRFCLAASRGRYVLLLGNDDALTTPTALQDLADALRALGYPEVAITNHRDCATGQVTRRALATKILGAGPDAAARFFRSFSFVSGLVFERAAAARHETARWDRSVYYQIYLACRIAAAGGRIGALDICTVAKDVRVDDQGVFNYVARWSGARRSFQSRHTGIDSVLRVTVDAIAPHVPERGYSALVRRVATQLLAVTYPFWLFEYRRIAGWSFAVGVARGLWPGALLAEYALGLLIPARLFNRLRDTLAAMVRSRQQSSKPLRRS